MEEHVQAIIDYISFNGWLALPIMAAISFAESLAFLSLLAPGIAIMIAAGTLAGTGVLDPWPVVLGAILGAVVGDSVSYWIGLYFGHRIAGVWPFRSRPHLLERAHQFCNRYGGFSVGLGRFLGPVRAVVPIVAGILEMPARQFWFWNVASALVWAPVVVFSGVFVGWAGERLTSLL